MGKGIDVISIFQAIINVLVAAGFLVSLIVGGPFGTAVLSLIVLPLVILDLVLCFFNEKKTLKYDVINVMMAALSFIPAVGVVFRIAGVVLALIGTVVAVSN